MDGAQRRAHRRGTVRRDAGGQCDRVGHGTAGLAHRIEHPVSKGGVGADGVAGEEQPDGHGPGQGTRTTKECPAGGDQATFDLGQAEQCRGRGHDQVTGEHEFEPAAERDPLDRCDDRLAPLAADESVLPPLGVAGLRGSFMSVPALKTWLVPVSTATRNTGSASNMSNAADNSSAICW